MKKKLMSLILSLCFLVSVSGPVYAKCRTYAQLKISKMRSGDWNRSLRERIDRDPRVNLWATVDDAINEGRSNGKVKALTVLLVLEQKYDLFRVQTKDKRIEGWIVDDQVGRFIFRDDKTGKQCMP